jgi:hypothetical protein
LVDFDSELSLLSLVAFSVLLLVIGALFSVYGVPKWLLSEDKRLDK